MVGCACLEMLVHCAVCQTVRPIRLVHESVAVGDMENLFNLLFYAKYGLVAERAKNKRYKIT